METERAAAREAEHGRVEQHGGPARRAERAPNPVSASAPRDSGRARPRDEPRRSRAEPGTAVRVAGLLRRLAAYRAALAASPAHEAGLTDAQARDLADVVRKNQAVCVEFLQILREDHLLEDSDSHEEAAAATAAAAAKTNSQAVPVDWSSLARALGEALRLVNTILAASGTERQHHERQTSSSWHYASASSSQANWRTRARFGTSSERYRRSPFAGREHADRQHERRSSSRTRDDEEQESDEEADNDRDESALQRAALVGGTAVATALVGLGTYQAVRAQQQGYDLDVFSEAVEIAQFGDGVRVNGDYSCINAENTGRLVAEDAADVLHSLRHDGVSVDGSLAQTSHEVMRISREMELTLVKIAGALEALRAASRSRVFVSGSFASAGALLIAQLWLLRSSREKVIRSSVLSSAGCAVVCAVHLARSHRAKAEAQRAAHAARILLSRLELLNSEMSSIREQVRAASQSYRESQVLQD